ncbi:MAG: type II toxin-antitoxin system antitoxin SocA domain-containing protein [Armatimonadota bacterium]
MFDPLLPANTIVQWHLEQMVTVTPLRVQKVLYYSHGWHLALAGYPMVSSPMEAWTWGPVNPRVYAAFERYSKDEPIRHLAFRENGESRKLEDESNEHSRYAASLARAVCDSLKGMSDTALFESTHEEGTPWEVAVRDFTAEFQRPPEPWDHEAISNAKIKHFFAAQLNNSSGETAAVNSSSRSDSSSR